MSYDFGSVGTVVKGAEASTDPSAHILPELPRSNFYLMHNPEGWEPVQRDDGGWEWLPVLKKLLIKPGVNGVRSTRSGSDDSQARIGFQDRGWTILNRDLGYITRYPCRKGYTYYLTWDKPIKAGRRVVIRHDEEGYNDFRRSLVIEGLIPKPVPEILTAILQSHQKVIDRNAKDIHIPAVKAKIEETQDLIDGAKMAANALTGKPKAKRTRAKKVEA